MRPLTLLGLVVAFALDAPMLAPAEVSPQPFCGEWRATERKERGHTQQILNAGQIYDEQGKRYRAEGEGQQNREQKS